jgi:hypothetical protein
MNTSPQQSSLCCIFAPRAISAREFLQHGVFGKRLHFRVNRTESEFFSNIIYLYNIDRYMFTVYYPLAGKENQGREEGTFGGSLVCKQLTSKQTERGRQAPRMLASERDGEVVEAARAIVGHGKSLAPQKKSRPVNRSPPLRIAAFCWPPLRWKMPANSASLACRPVLPPRSNLQLCP